MPGTMAEQPLLELFAEILEYPGRKVRERVRLAEQLCAETRPEAAEAMARFRASIENMPLERLEEVYTSVFDLNATCHPYAGYQLFGETYKRSAFLVGLKNCYRAHGFVADETELPDRLSVMLRFVSRCDDSELNAEIVDYALAPSLAKMSRAADPSIKETEESDDNPYQNVLKALLAILRREQPAETAGNLPGRAGGNANVR